MSVRGVEEKDERTNLLQDVVRNHLRRDLFHDLLTAVDDFGALHMLSSSASCPTLDGKEREGTHPKRRLMPMQRANPLRNSKHRVLLLESQRLNMLFEDILERRDRGIVLDDPDGRGEGDRDGEGEVEVALAGLFAVREGAVRVEAG
jgi:hypothetical protein